MKPSHSTLPHIFYSFFMVLLGILLFSNFSYAVGEIADAPVISLSSTSVTEGQTANVVIRINRCPVNTMTVSYTTSDGSATAGTDYTAKSGSVTFTAGGGCTRSFSIPIPTIDDTQVEGNEAFNVTLSGASTTSTSVTIQDNDVAPSHTVSIAKEAKDGNGIWQNSQADSVALDDISYRIMAKNTGNTNTTLKITDSLPTGLHVNSVSIDGTVPSAYSCTHTDTSITCDGNHTFFPGEGVTILLHTRSDNRGSFRNVATVTTPHTTASDAVNTHIGLTELISNHGKTLTSPPPYQPNNTANYRLTATNGSTSTAREIKIIDKLGFNYSTWDDNAFEYLSYTSTSMDCNYALNGGHKEVTCISKSPVAPGATVTADITVKFAKTGSLCNVGANYGKDAGNWIYVHSDKVCVTVNEKRDANASDDDYTVIRGETLHKNILDNDTGDGKKVTSLHYASSSNLPDGALTWQNNGAISYTAPDNNGTLAYTYTMEDDYGNTSTAILTIQVVTPPISAKDDHFDVTKNIAYDANVLTNNGQGADQGTEISISNHTEPSHGTLSIQPDGTFHYNPTQDYIGDDSFTYTITDKFHQTSTATVDLTVAGLVSSRFTDFYLVNPPETRNIIGNYAVAGNTVTCLTNQDGTVNGSHDYHAACSNSFDINNNAKLVRYIDIDHDTSTWNSSSSVVTLPDTYDKDNGGILWAGLFWQGSINHFAEYGGISYTQRRAKSSAGGFTYDTYDGTVGAINITNTDANKVKLKIDASAYSDITSDTLFYNIVNGNIGTYAAYANVTSLFKHAALDNGDHTITLANITGNEGREMAIGNYGGWSLVVIYKEDADNDHSKARNISIYNGFVAIGSGAKDASGHDITKKELTISGFKLPKAGDVNAKITSFVGEGEKKYGGSTTNYDTMNIKDHATTIYEMPSSTSKNMFDGKLSNISRNSTIPNNALDNANGIDIDNYDVSSILTDIRDLESNVSDISIQVISKDTNPNDAELSDYVTPSMIAFSAQLYVPNICYNYTLDIGGFVLGSTNNRIQTPALFVPDKPLSTHISIMSKEGDFTLKESNITYSIDDTTQLKYVTDSVGIAKNKISHYQNAGTSGLNQAYAQQPKGFGLYVGENAGQAPNGPGGDMDAFQMRYIRFDDRIVGADLNTSFSLDLKYKVDYGSGPLELTKHFNQQTLCPIPPGYRTMRGRFNVTSEHADDTTGKPFNLYTQVANRPFSIKVFSQDENLTNLINRNLAVEVEPFNANFYSKDADVACHDVDSIVSNSQFVRFNNTSHVAIPNLNYNFAMRNIGFRVWYLEGTDNLLVNHTCTDASDETCFHTLYTSKYAENDTKCQTACTGSHTGCYMCLRKFYGRASCSQDNFSIRPNAFVSLIKDSNQSNSILGVTTNNISHSHSPSPLGLSPNASIVAGYKYRFDMNATNFQDDKATPRYVGLFDGNYNHSRYVQFQWDSNYTSADCANTDDVNITLPLMDGSSVISSLDFAYTQSLNQLGEYKLVMFDQNWTAVDWAETTHHLTNNPEWSNIEDCVKQDTTTLGIAVNDNTDRNGCAISNIHADSHNTYVAPKLHTYPYSFDLTRLDIGAGPNRDKSYVFMDTLAANVTDYDMSYNIQGILQAKAFPAGKLVNFTKTCYAADINMTLGTIYRSTLPQGEETNFRYNLMDYKKSGAEMFARKSVLFNKTYVKDVETAIVVPQEKSVFTQEMNASINMDLSYNFDRTNDTPVNPRAIRFSDFNVTYTTPPSKLYFNMRDNYEVESTRAINQNVTFVYGRVKPSQLFYDNVTTDTAITPLSITAYCADVRGTCLNDYNLSVISNNPARSNEAFWWFVQQHGAGREGSVALDVPAAATHTVLPERPVFVEGIAHDVSVTYASTVRPYTAVINLITSEGQPNFTHRWLIYNPDGTGVPNPFYRVRFINTSNWTGVGKTGHVVGDDINTKSNRKREW